MAALWAREGATTWFHDLRSEDFPRPLPHSITLHGREGAVGVEVNGVCGSLPLRTGGSLHIAPKIGGANFLRMLASVAGITQWSVGAEYGRADEATLAEMVVRRFVVAAAEAWRQSLRPVRTTRRCVGAHPSGRLDVVATQLRMDEGRLAPFVGTSKVRTHDTAENRLIAISLRRAWDLLEPALQRQYDGVVECWSGVVTPSEIDQDLAELLRRPPRPGGARWYYDELLALAQVLLGVGGIAPAGSGISADVTLIDTARVFEEWVRTQVRQSHEPDGYTVSKGSGVFLYLDDSFQLEPDIVVARPPTDVLIADAKYKRVSSDDHYQMGAYLTRYEVDRGVLIAPSEGHEVLVTERRRGRFVVSELYLPMGDLDMAEQKLATLTNDFT